MSKEKVHVLLVEDEEAHAELIRRAFEAQSNVINLTVASSLEEARSCLTEALPDLAIVDLFLPDGRGLELLNERDEESKYPVMIMTSHGNEEAAVQAMKAGALQYVVKSEVALAELPLKVEGALRQWGHIIERRQAEEALKANEAHYRSLIERAQDLILVLDKEGKIQYASPSSLRLIGFEPEACIGKSFWELVHEEDQATARDMLEKAFAEDEPVPAEFRSLHNDGTYRYLETIAASHQFDERRINAILNSRDVTERRQAEESQRALEGRLRQLQNWESIANLAGDISREFSLLLGPVRDYATMALQETAQGTKNRAAMERVLAAGNRAQELAERIFSFSRRATPQAEAVQLPEIINRELERVAGGLPPNIQLRETIHEDSGAVMADPQQIAEVLKSLCDNAVEAMRDLGGGTLEVRLEPITLDESSGLNPGNYNRLTVSDTGHGMDEATVEQAKKPFFTTRDATGLGLSVAHAIAISHGGDLNIQSEIGIGTTVQVDLPQA